LASDLGDAMQQYPYLDPLGAIRSHLFRALVERL
jgi:hypothetical protein